MSRQQGWSAAMNQARLEDLTFMAETGETATGAAQRLGLSLSALEKWARTNPEARPAWLRLRAREAPITHQKEGTAA